MRTIRLAVTALAVAVCPVLGPGPSYAAEALCHGRAVTIAGTSDDDVLVGTDGPDVLRGFEGRDTITGLGGDDVVCGGRGRDDLDGGAGRDWVGGGHQPDRLHGGPGDDVLRGGANRDTAYGDGGADRMLVEGRDVLDYSDSPGPVTADLSAGTVEGWGSDTVVGGSSGLGLLTGAFDDQVVGSGGGDLLMTGDGDDVVQAGDGIDQVYPGPGANTTTAGDGDDLVAVTADDAADEVRAGAGDDFVEGDAGRFDSGTGPHDRVYGGAGVDYLTVETDFSPDQVVDGGSDGDHLHLGVRPAGDGSSWQLVTIDLAAGTMTGDGRTVLVPGIGNLTVGEPLGVGHVLAYGISGTDGPDRISAIVHAPVTVDGLGGDDSIVTGFGDDILDGGPGTDLAYAGDGQDDCTSVEGEVWEGGGTGCETTH